MELIGQAATLLYQCRKLVVFTGSGVSAESGLATFRGAGGLWEGHRVEEVATPEAFASDPLFVWRFYEMRREKAKAAQPNPGHRAIADLEELFAGLVVVTQNVDGLHQRAGSTRVLELHGSLWTLRCSRCGASRREERVPLPSLPPQCPHCGGPERPGVVWFGEPLEERVWRQAQEACQQAEGMLVVGTSGLVWPAAGLVELAAAAGAKIVEVNPVPSLLASWAHLQLPMPAGSALPALAQALREVLHAGI